MLFLTLDANALRSARSTSAATYESAHQLLPCSVDHLDWVQEIDIAFQSRRYSNLKQVSNLRAICSNKHFLLNRYLDGRFSVCTELWADPGVRLHFT